jgi:beta-glucosidase
MTGSAIALPYESEHVPAIINAWYGGQSAGIAIADVLFGDYNPAGRLPVTFYKSDHDLPDFNDYSMTGRTYRYFKGEALYPFGFGLSYTTFKYDGLKTGAFSQSGKDIRVSAQVTNTGKKDGEEVVQLYLSYQQQKQPAPIRALKGFQRISLKAGERKVVHFTLTPQQLSLVNEEGKQYQPRGKVMISVGGGQPNVHTRATGNVISTVVTVL